MVEMAQRTRPVPVPAAAARGERELLAAFRGGDREAGELLVERTHRDVFGALVRFTGGDVDLAADLTQETYRRAWQALPRFRGGSRLGTWLYRIAYTTFLNHLRRSSRVVPLDPAMPGGVPEEALRDPRPVDHEVVDRETREAVLALPEPLRYTVTARFWRGLTVGEIASAEGVTPVAIRKRLKKAFRLLEQSLEESN